MLSKFCPSVLGEIDSVIIPFNEELKFIGEGEIHDEILKISEAVFSAKLFTGKSGAMYSGTVEISGKIVNFVFVGVCEKDFENYRKVFLNFAKAFKKLKDLGAANIAVYLDNVLEFSKNPMLCEKIFELPYIVSYNFHMYKKIEEPKNFEKVYFALNICPDCFDGLLEEAKVVGESTCLARELGNYTPDYLTPEKLAEEAVKMCNENGLESKVFGKEEIKAFGMESFLAVARGAATEPRFIVMRYFGADKDTETIGLVGKGITFDSGGYSLKPTMVGMNGDMCGAAAVIGAMRSLAQRKVKVNVVGVIAACENKISGEAYVPSEILRTMNGKTIEMLNADAEGRLTLADAVTYIIREEKVNKVIDIATLTGAANVAVGYKTAPVMSNDEELYAIFNESAKISCEKVWRLDTDEELVVNIDSVVADIKNVCLNTAVGGGTIIGGMFIKAFVEDLPWLHIDMASVSWTSEEGAYLFKGATGYGVSLLYNAVKKMAK